MNTRLLELLTAARDGKQRARVQLNEWLRNDARARSSMAGLLVDEQALMSQLRQENIVAMLGSKPLRMLSAAPRPVPLKKERSGWLPLAAAAMLVAGLLAWFQFEGWLRLPAAGATATAPVAVLKESAFAVWKGNAPPIGSALIPGPLLLESGMAAIEFNSGARVLLEGPAVLELISADQAFCRMGKIRAQVPPPAHGFTVGTPKMRVVDLGTAYGLAVKTDGSTLVKVMQGEVELHGGTTVQSVKKDAAVAIDAAGTVKATRLPDEAFPTEANFQERLAAGDRQHAARWQTAASGLPPILPRFFITPSRKPRRPAAR